MPDPTPRTLSLSLIVGVLTAAGILGTGVAAFWSAAAAHGADEQRIAELERRMEAAETRLNYNFGAAKP